MSVAISLCLWHEHMHTPCTGTLHIQPTPSLIQNHPAWELPLLGVACACLAWRSCLKFSSVFRAPSAAR